VIALARKYRPRNFATVAVQSHVSNTLKGAIARGRVAHGYLLCGPRGVGKTTLARVLAMALNCENKRPDGEPCGECASCTRIWSGGASLDVVEIDAASNRGVDDARELRERAMYAPSGEGRYKVYIVDEAHMLTREAWNALLKILEEPPPRVVFVFATTEPQKIAQAAAPVLSRLQRFDFRRMGPGDIRERVGAVLAEEGVSAEGEALGMIARAADGSMRDALSLTDQVLALGDGGVTTQRVREALGLVAEDEFLALLDIIAERRAGDVFDAVSRLVDQGVDLGQFLTGLGDILRAQLALSLGAAEVEVSAAAREALAERKDRISAGDLLRMLNALTELEPRFRRSGQQQLLLEALLVRFALLDRTVELESLLRDLGGAGGSGGGESRVSGGARPSAGSRSPAAGGEARTSYRTAPPTVSDSSAAPIAPERPARLPRPDARMETPVETPRVQERVPPPPGDGPPSRGGSVRAERPGPTRIEAGPGLEVDGGGTATMAPPAVREENAPGVRVEEATHRAGPPNLATPKAAIASLEINHLVGQWDDIVAAIRRERPIVGTLLEHALPTAVSGTGSISLQMEDRGAFENLAAKSRELTGALSQHIPGLQRVQLIPPDSPDDNGPRRMTAESIKSETLQALRKKDPILSAAIDELDLDLIV